MKKATLYKKPIVYKAKRYEIRINKENVILTHVKESNSDRSVK